jgi:hypothetical protein
MRGVASGHRHRNNEAFDRHGRDSGWLDRPSAGSAKAAQPGGSGGLRERSPDYIRRSLPFTWPLVGAWFRPEIRGLDRIPASGPVLLVGNHSGGNVAPDTPAFTLSFYRRDIFGDVAE